MHAMKFYQYLIDTGGVARIPSILAPEWNFDSVIKVFEASLYQEREVTRHIYDLYKIAQNESDFATVSFLKCFVDEQVEEEKNVFDMIDKLKMAQGNRIPFCYWIDTHWSGNQNRKSNFYGTAC